MMFSMEKCTGRGTRAPEDCEVFAVDETLGKEGEGSDEVASAVAAVSDEIGDILKDELDADRAERIGAELADLSAELGLLAGLADTDAQPDFASRFEVPFEWIAMGRCGSGSGSSSSSWSAARGGRPRRPTRPARAPRRRPIAKGKEVSRRLGAMGRRAASGRVARVEVLSDASDVGADCDSDDQWTELDDNSGSSDSSSLKEGLAIVDCDFHHKGAEASAPAMGQFLLPLVNAPHRDTETFLVRHDDILQLLASAEAGSHEPEPAEEPADTQLCAGAAPDGEEGPVLPDEEAALLHYVCEWERLCSDEQPTIQPVEEWLLGVYHSWCEISALMYTLIPYNMSEVSGSEWAYRARWGCHCRLCLSLAAAAPALHAFLHRLVAALASGGEIGTAAGIVRALKLRADVVPDCQAWDIARLQRLHVPDDGVAIIHSALCELSAQGGTAAAVVRHVCECRALSAPLHSQHAMERFCRILESFKAASIINFKVDIIPVGGAGASGAEAGGDGGGGRAWRGLPPLHRASTAQRLHHMRTRTTPHDLSAWAGYKHRCDCLSPRTLCAQQRKQLLSSANRISFFGMMQAVNELGKGTERSEDTGAPAALPRPGDPGDHSDDSNRTPLTDDLSSSDGASGTASLGLSTSSSLDSASELLLAAAAAVDEGGSEGEGGSGSTSGSGSLCRTVRHLMRSIASIERLMDRVLKHCDDWPAPHPRDHDTRKRVDQSLSEVDRKLMAMYRRLPEVHRRQLQVYRKQKKLSTVCMQLVGGRAPLPPPPGSPPPAPPPPARALQPDYHLQRFREVRRKVMHMRDQQLYYHRLRMWLEDQLRHERESLPDANVTLIEDLPRRKRRTSSPKLPRLAATKRKLKPTQERNNFTITNTKPHKILQLLKHKAPQAELINTIKAEIKNDELKLEVDPPEAFPLEKDDNISDTDTVVGEKETELCKDMKDCLAKFANFALGNDKDDNDDVNDVKYPDSVSPPLQEMSPTTSEPMPVYSAPKPNQRLLSTNLINRHICEAHEKLLEQRETTQITPEIINIPINACRTPLFYKDMKDEGDSVKLAENENAELIVETGRDPNIYKYVSFGIEIKKAMEECQNIINSYNTEKDKDREKDRIDILEGPMSLEQICEIMMTLDRNDDVQETTENQDFASNDKLAELVENMPQILANMPEIASKLSEFANASFELPEFASIMNSLPDVNNEAQLTPETLKQIRELKLNKNRDNIKITKNTAKRKFNRRIKSTDTDIIETMTFQLDSKELSEMFKEEMKSVPSFKEDFKDILFSISAQVVINKVFEYLKQNKSPELAKCMEEDKDLFILPTNNINSEMYSKASTLFDNSVKDALCMDELRALVKSRFNSWKNYVATKFKNIPLELLDNEIEAMLDKFYSYIQDLAEKQCANDSDKIIEKIDDLRKNKDVDSDSESCPASKESLKQIKKLLSTSAGNTFDLLIMKLSKMSQDKKTAVKSLKFKYINVIRRCAESQQLVGWILLDPEIAATVIQELTGLPIKKVENVPDFTSMNKERRVDYFIRRLRDMNRLYMESLPKKALTGDEWLVMLYRLEQLEDKLRDAFAKVNPPVLKMTQNASEAEILAAKGLSKIIGKANVRIVKKSEPKKEETKEAKEASNEKEEKKSKNEALLAKCEAILTSKGEKSLLDSFYTIKSYITQGLPVPETYKKHVISICSSIDAKLLDEDIENTLRLEMLGDDDLDPKEKLDRANLAVINSQNPELLAKYSAQALRNAKQTLNAVAFRNMMRNGQTKSESDACDTPKSDCKWTSDCVCSSCTDGERMESKQFDDKNGDDKKKKVAAKVAKQPTKCENATHQQHVCKVGHAGVGGGAGVGAGAGPGAAMCAGEAGPDQPCSCCYCTVFGHAPPLTTPVPRNFNETRERLRSILNKKKQKCKTTNGEPEPPQIEKKPTPVPQPVEAQPQIKPKPIPAKPIPAKPVIAKPEPVKPVVAKPIPAKPIPAKPVVAKPVPAKPVPAKPVPAKPVPAKPVPAKPVPAKPVLAKPVQTAQPVQQPVQPKPQALVPPSSASTSAPTSAVAAAVKRANADRQLADKMARMAVTDTDKPKALQRTVPVQVNVPPAVKTEGKVNANAMEQIRLQQVKQQQLQQQQQQQLQQQQQQHLASQAQTSEVWSSGAGAGAHSLSSRDTSVLSTCSGESCWVSGRGADPRDLDALLQYIEGPARHVDRGKKRAKKQRQKAKRMEAKLLEEKATLAGRLNAMRREMEAMVAAHSAAQRRVQDVRKALDQAHHKKKGKKQKLTPAQQAKVQQMADQLGELTSLLNTAAKEVHESEKQVQEYSRRLAECERELVEARAVQGKCVQPLDQAAMAAKQQAIHQQIQQQQLAQQQQLQLEHQRRLQHELDKREKQAAILNATSASNIIRVRRLPADGAPHDAALQHLLHANAHLTVLNVREPLTAPAAPAVAAKPAEKKQTWEQALAHMNQLVNTNKDKKKKEKEAKSESKQKQQQRSMSLPDTEQPLSKKQRKLLAKQQAEEEEKKRLEQEAKAKKAEKKQEVKQEKKAEKKEQGKKQPEPKKEEKKKEAKKEKTQEKKGKENKQEKNANSQPAKPAKQPAPPPAKKDKKKDKQTNIAHDTTIELVTDKPACAPEPDKPASCSIMEQLSCGVQVQDLRLPPGITLTRVQPCEKKEPPPIKSVPVWKCSQLSAAPTPVARPPPVIAADPSLCMFSAHNPHNPHTPVEQQKTIIVGSPVAPVAPPVPAKSKKNKKKGKKTAEEEGAKMVTLRNPMFHAAPPPPAANNKQEIKIPEPIPMPPNACQATITPTSNGMYTIRNPLMSMMHQQSLMGMRTQAPQMNPMYNQPQYNYVNPNVYNPVQPVPQTYVIDPARNSPKNDEFQSRIMNLASFTQKNDEGYSLFKTNDDSQQRNFLAPEYFVENNNPKPTVSPNPIGTRPSNDRNFESESLFANPARPEPIGTPLKREEERSDFSSLYTPFGQEDRNVFRNALFNDKNETNMNKLDDINVNHMSNGDPLPYFQRLRVGSKLNNEVTIHHVTESKFYKGQEGVIAEESLFSRPAWDHPPHYNNTAAASSTSSPTAESLSSAGSPPDDIRPTESSVFLPDRSITNLSTLEVSEREIESFKRFEFYFEPPHNKPKVQFDVRDIANALRHNHK